MKYSAPGGCIEVTLQQNEMFTKFQVRDHGLGIEAGEENQIFRRFYRGRRVTVQEGFRAQSVSCKGRSSVSTEAL